MGGSRGSRLVRVAVASLVAVVALGTACSPNDVADPDGGGEGAQQGGPSELVYGNSDGGTTYALNFNVYSPATDTSPNSDLIYEPLVRTDYSDGGAIKPWLAQSWEFNEDGTELTFTLRDDVTFSDGEPLTVDDVVFSLLITLDNPELAATGATYTSVEAAGDGQVRVVFEQTSFQRMQQFSDLQIVPEHLWAEQDLTSWTNPEPVGTGGYTLEAFSPQQLTFTARDDYWGGQFQVPTIKVVPVGDSVHEQLLDGEVEWGTIAWANAEEEFVASDPQTHLYQLYSTGGSYAAFFNTARPPFDDVHVRRALAMTIPRSDLVETLGRPETEANPTGLQDGIFDDWLLPEYQGAVQEMDVEGALDELEQSDYTVQDGALVKDGQSYSPRISFNTDFSWQNYADFLINSWRENLGIEVTPAGSPGAVLLEQQELGDFDITINTAGGSNVFDAYSGLGSQYAVPEGQRASSNYGRWDDPDTDEIITQMAATDDPDQVRELGYQMQQIVAEQVPYSPIYANFWFICVNATDWTGWPTPEDFDHVPYPEAGPETTLTLLALQPRN